jgi:hypothetical protein
MAGNRSVASRAFMALGAAAVMFGQLACYTLKPVQGGVIPTIGSRIAVDINDQGRVALGGLMGPEIRQIEGRLVRNETAEIEVAVSMVRMLRGGEQTWTDEKVRVSKEHISMYYEKELSRGRTVAASAAGVGLIVIFLGKGIAGFVSGDEDASPPDTSNSVRRPVRPPIRP